MQRQFRVDFSRPVKPVAVLHGLPVVEDSGMNYVDVFFPDGTQRVWGYIGRTPQCGDQFAPLAGCSQQLSNLIQSEINRQLGCEDGGALPPQIVEKLDGDDDDVTEDDDE